MRRGVSTNPLMHQDNFVLLDLLCTSCPTVLGRLCVLTTRALVCGGLPPWLSFVEYGKADVTPSDGTDATKAAYIMNLRYARADLYSNRQTSVT